MQYSSRKIIPSHGSWYARLGVPPSPLTGVYWNHQLTDIFLLKSSSIKTYS
jgi:hypothetical protein